MLSGNPEIPLISLPFTEALYRFSLRCGTPRPNPLTPFPRREGGTGARLPSGCRGGAGGGVNLYLTKDENRYTFAEAIADLEALMAHLGWSAAHVVGHSWTGKLALIWARQHPERLHSMILVDPIFVWKMPSLMKVTFPILYRVLPFLRGMGPFASYEQAQQQARQLNLYEGWTPLQQQVFQAGIEQKPDGRWGSKFVVPARDQIFEDVMQIAGLTTPIDIPTSSSS